MKNLFRLLRCRQYLKNLLVLAALFCSGEFFNRGKLLCGILGTLTFCLISSFVYILNDFFDRDRDRKHPEKKNRPLATRTVSVRCAAITAGVLLVSGFLLNAAVFHPVSTVLLIVYLAINLLYSLGLKNVPILDLAIVAAGFLIRLQYGAVITGIAVSDWLFLTVLALSFYFALSKRKSEQKAVGPESRDVLQYYSTSFLERHQILCMGLAIVFYALWSIDARTLEHHGSPYLVYTVLLLILILMRYNRDLEKSTEEDPVEVVLRDPVLLAGCAAFLVILFIIFY